MDKFKEQAKQIVNQAADLTQTIGDEFKQELHHQVVKEKVKNKIDAMHCTYENIKQEIKEEVLDRIDPRS